MGRIYFLERKSGEAAGQKSQRLRVEAILKTIEQAENDRHDAGEEFIDASQLWDELEIEPA
jgi:hypothetical protein